MKNILYIVCMIGIYKITSPDGKVYIGQSCNIDNRKRTYRRLACKGQRKLYNSLKKYKFKNHVFEVILYCDQSTLDKMEKLYFTKYKNLGIEMLNLMEPGEKGNKGHSEETKMIISRKKLGGKITQFAKDGSFIRIWNSIHEASCELGIIRTSIEASMSGRSKTAGGFVFRRGVYSSGIEPISERKKYKSRIVPKGLRKKRPVIQMELDGEFIKEWPSMTIAAEILNLNKGCISACSTGKIKQTGGYKWSKVKK